MPAIVGPRRALLNADPLAGLRRGLVSSWRLQEASGVAVDSYGTNTLTNNNSVGTTAGPGSFQARSFVSASSQYLSVADNASLSMGTGVPFALAGWVKFTTTTGNPGIAGKWNGGTSQREYLVSLLSSAPRIIADVSTDGSSGNDKSVGATTFGNVTTGVWYFVYAQCDLTNVGVSLNAGPLDTTACTQAFDGTAAFELGAFAGAANFLNGALALWALWKRTLTAAERTQLFNGGNGVAL